MKLLVTAVAMAALVAPAFATKVDMGAATCADTKTWDANTAGMYLMWLDGYMSGKTDDTVLDTDAVQSFATQIDEICSKDPSQKLLDITNQAMQAQ